MDVSDGEVCGQWVNPTTTASDDAYPSPKPLDYLPPIHVMALDSPPRRPVPDDFSFRARARASIKERATCASGRLLGTW